MAANVFAYAGYVAIAAVFALLAREMLPDDQLAGIPSAAATVGTALAATPLALRAKRRGRRLGIRPGYLLGVVGAVLGFVAGAGGLFLLFVASALLLGAGQASTLQNRYAAADLATDDRRARDISAVVWVGTVGGVLGPILAKSANDIGVTMGMRVWVAPMVLGAIGFALGWAIIESRLRPDPLEVAGGIDPDATHRNPFEGVGQAWRAVAAVPLARLAMTAMAVSQMAMVAVMVMTPLHMADHGHADLSLFVLSVHVFGMYGLAPLIGRWADRRGRVVALRMGAVTLGVGTVATVVAGYVPALMFAGLLLLGIGWNFAFVAGSALLTECLPLNDRLGAQGLSDVLMSALAALAAVGSGFVKAAAGFHWLSIFATGAALAVFIFAMSVDRSREPLHA